ncbi:hypothetical protein HNO88_003379 [Novosphingobium chloroacetimidivorans]|uniref:DUF2793 domain-containing protein n=1 Tax=Novosphingobium chloroacetimidivorans TaxID=1428314 RepID=A0A7W7KCQ5_9SPHN|nr:DUF2793 domain-containing protein [Novosphingobium chloroacetimidivorans]MBB4860041.1 hypothetical protein [Novosphingobium chloroacetimidivorans]
MPDALDFTATTARHGLPLLFAAQAQKEVFHNEALARIDALMHAAIEGESTEPPTIAPDGQSWLVAPAATGEWAGHDHAIAMRQAGQWLFAAPVPGMRVYDQTSGQFALFSDGWQKAAAIPEPSGGLMVDSEARAAIGALLLALRASGLLPPA